MAKVKFGLSNVHIFPITAESGETTTYGEAFALPGAVNLTLDPTGNETTFYADDIAYYKASTNNGYSGSLEIAMLNEDFITKILGRKNDDNGVNVETSDDKAVSFGMTYELQTDEGTTKIVLYRCTANRPAIGSSTIAESREPKTDSFDFSALPRISDHIVRATTDSTNAAAATWDSTIYEPTFTQAEG